MHYDVALPARLLALQSEDVCLLFESIMSPVYASLAGSNGQTIITAEVLESRDKVSADRNRELKGFGCRSGSLLGLQQQAHLAGSDDC